MRAYDVQKYLAYTLERRSFAPDWGGTRPSASTLETARRIRGAERGAAVMIHGIMPRSGTVYVGELLRLHPDLHAYPHQVWELPFLQLTGDVMQMQAKFLQIYEQNAGKIGAQDFLPLFGAALVAYLHAGVPDGRRMLLKVPSVQYLSAFGAVFPHEHLLVLVRDGRDVVQSTLRTWPQLQFWQVCTRWNRAARMVLAVDQQMKLQTSGYWLARYENALQDPAGFVREACRRFGLEEDRYPYEEIEAIPVQGSSALTEEGAVHWAPVDRPTGFQPVGYWRSWPRWKRWAFKRIAGEALLALGYGGETDW